MHTIVTKVYEKAPQTLAEAIREVEKLQAAQQLTSSLLPRVISEHYVKRSREMLSMSKSRPYGTLLPPHKML